jgi:hypothetical protein
MSAFVLGASIAAAAYLLGLWMGRRMERRIMDRETLWRRLR